MAERDIYTQAEQSAQAGAAAARVAAAGVAVIPDAPHAQEYAAGGQEGTSATSETAASDTEPGGPALVSDPFHLGRLHMLQREEAIYRSSYLARNSHLAADETHRQDKVKPPEEMAHAREYLHLRQDRECSLFKELLAACTSLAMGESTAPSLETRPVLTAPEQIDQHLKAFIDCVSEGGALLRASGSTLFTCGESPAERIYGARGEDYTEPDIAQDGGLAWVHVKDYDADAALEEGPLFPHRRTQPSKFAWGKKDDKGAKKIEPGVGANKQGRSLFSRLLRVMIFACLMGLGYVVLSSKGCAF